MSPRRGFAVGNLALEGHFAATIRRLQRLMMRA
jgi:hypothetical protein